MNYWELAVLVPAALIIAWFIWGPSARRQLVGEEQYMQAIGKLPEGAQLLDIEWGPRGILCALVREEKADRVRWIWTEEKVLQWRALPWQGGEWFARGMGDAPGERHIDICQPLGAGWLIVDAKAEEGEADAWVLDADGQIQNELFLRKGAGEPGSVGRSALWSVCVDDADRIWVLDAQGVRHYTRAGETLHVWSKPSERVGTLCLSGKGAWVFPFGRYRLGWLDGETGEAREYDGRMQSGSALCARGDAVLIWAQKLPAMRLALEQAPRTTVQKRYTLKAPQSGELKKPIVSGRGDALAFSAEGTVYVWRLPPQ